MAHDPRPLDPRPEPRSALGWCSVVLLVAAIGLALGNADSARNWSEGLKPNPVSLTLRDACERWAAFTKATHLSVLRDAVRATWGRRHDLGWGELEGDIAQLRRGAQHAADRVPQR